MAGAGVIDLDELLDPGRCSRKGHQTSEPRLAMGEYFLL